MVWAKEHGRFDSKIFKSANPFRIESDGRFEFEQNLEALQVPSSEHMILTRLIISESV